MGDIYMRKVRFLLGFAILLWGSSTAIGQNNWASPCEPINPCAPCGVQCGVPNGSPFTFGGWVEFGMTVNNHNSRSVGEGNGHGPMFFSSNQRTDFQMNQLYLFGEKELDTRRGFDCGGRVDLLYGTDYDVSQTLDGRFDAGLGTNRHGYGLSLYQLYGTVGFEDLSIKVGKFMGYVGWEGLASKDNFFYSHSYCYMIEPASHMGAMAEYDLTDRLSIGAGWVTGPDSSFSNPYGSHAVLAGFNYALADDANIYYWFNTGRQGDGEEGHSNYFIQSVCFEWDATDRFTYVMQYNLANGASSAYGINNHFLYRLTDKLGAGMRFEWLRNNGGYISNWTEGEPMPGDFFQLTWGLNWEPHENVSIRPEIRYDWCRGVTPFGKEGDKREQLSGGFGVVLSF
jgi:hypothetical protein